MVLRALLGRDPTTSPAEVVGWRAVRLPQRPYPALVPSLDLHSKTEGLLLEGIKPDEWRLLDDFEDEVYDLMPLDLLDGRTGWAYVCHDHDIASGAPWDYDAFAHDDLPTYVGRCRAWRARRSER